MENKNCVLLGYDFDDIEGVTVINILRRLEICFHNSILQQKNKVANTFLCRPPCFLGGVLQHALN